MYLWFRGNMRSHSPVGAGRHRGVAQGRKWRSHNKLLHGNLLCVYCAHRGCMLYLFVEEAVSFQSSVMLQGVDRAVCNQPLLWRRIVCWPLL